MLLAYAPTGSGNGGGVASGGAIGGAATPSSGGEEVVGAVALRALAGHTGTFSPGDAVAGAPLADVCEMKRLFVLPGHHGLGAGAALVRALLPAAAELGYGCMVRLRLCRLQRSLQRELTGGVLAPCACTPAPSHSTLILSHPPTAINPPTHPTIPPTHPPTRPPGA
mgnify:CR=1 FL=1